MRHTLPQQNVTKIIMSLARLDLDCAFSGGNAKSPDLLSPLHQTRRVTGQFMLEHLLATEMLPVWIFHPLGDHALVAFLVQRFQVVKPYNQPRWQGWSSTTRFGYPTKLLLKRLPVYRFSYLYQRMAQVQLTGQRG